MSHLTEEQLEDLLQGHPTESIHIQACELCRSRLKEKQALATRLKSAFADLVPSEELAQKIRNQIATKSDVPRIIHHNHHWKRWVTTLSSVAAIVLVGLLLKVVLMPTPVYAALVEIHQHNLSEGLGYLPQTDPNILAEHFQKELGFNPRLPELGQGLALRGCCIKHFKDRVVGSYVVDTPQGIISIVAVKDAPDTMGMKVRSTTNDHTYYQSHFAKCDMVAVQIDHYTYCAIGEVTPEYLQTLLEKLIP